jgi:hypothetical protein
MLVNRMIRAAMLDTSLYEEVEHDSSATSQAMQVVLIVALASGIGGALWKLLTLNPIDAVSGLVGGILVAVLGWLAWALVTYIIGAKIFGGTATYGEMLRTLGFAQSPNVLLIFTGILGGIPLLGGLLRLALLIWVLLAGLIAIRQALDVSTGKAVLTAIIGWIVMAIIVGIVASVFGIGLPAEEASAMLGTLAIG